MFWICYLLAGLTEATDAYCKKKYACRIFLIHNVVVHMRWLFKKNFSLPKMVLISRGNIQTKRKTWFLFLRSRLEIENDHN